MPIKSFKFSRRKSSGTILEDGENPTQSSFRVFERPSTGRKSLSDGNLLKNGDSGSPPEDDNIFAGSDGPVYRNLYEDLTFQSRIYRSEANGLTARLVLEEI
jgi:hypothetical protein